MTSMPDVPPPGGPPARRSPVPATASRTRRADPARYVGGLLIWQGSAWLLMSAAGLACWILLVPASAGRGTTSGAVLWAGAALLATMLGSCAGAAQLCLACRLRGRSRWTAVAATGFRVVALTTAVAAVAVAVMIVGSLLEVLTLNGVS